VSRPSYAPQKSETPPKGKQGWVVRMASCWSAAGCGCGGGGWEMELQVQVLQVQVLQVQVSRVQVWVPAVV